ncbi:MAG TPA: glycosyltransferase [Pseudonocardiaceae bacterium]|jgi:glycosyltransferase involved in cell wall biosynthesis|nr:glycosyltransferase [Pseudonocardiaceae bacterium]
MRVAVVITRLAGGAGMLALRGARALGAGYEITIVTGGSSRLSLARAEAAGLPVIIEPSLRASLAPVADLVAVRRLAGLLRGFDVVHTHCAKAGAVGRIAARRIGVPRIVHTYHGFPFHRFQSPPRRAAYIRIERMLGRHTDVALAVGGGVAAEAARLRLVAPGRLRTIGVAVDHDAPVRTPASRARARLALGVPADATVVGAVGRLAPQKAPEDFVAALRTLRRPEVLGVWIGGGAPPRQRDRVMFVGERPDVPELLPAFDVFALPSRYEGLPLAIVEAMVCGVPVVATAVNAVPDVVLPGETGLLVPPGHPDLLAAGIRQLLDHPVQAGRFAANARDRIAGRHDERELGRSLAAAYREQPSTGRGALDMCDPAERITL